MIYLFLTKVTQNTVLLMDFHYSMLLCVCDMLLHLIIYKY